MAEDYRFFLNGTVIADAPMGWSKSSKKIKRDAQYKALFVEYVPNLTFYGDGYTLLNNLITASGFCQEVQVIIQQRCSEFTNFTNYFIGIIKLNTIEVDEERCFIKCNVEDNNLSALLKLRDDVRVKLSTTRTISGLTLSGSNPIKNISIHQSNAVAYDTRKGYFVSDAFQVLLSYISDNQITFSSTYYTTATSNRVAKAIIFTNPTVDLVGGANFVMTYRNFFGQIITVTVAKLGTVALTLAAIVDAINFNTSVGTTDMDKYLQQDSLYWALATDNGTSAITLTVDLNFEILTITGAAVQASSFGATGMPTHGMGKLVMMTGSQLNNSAKPIIPEVSFKEMFEELNKYSNLGMSMTYNATTNKTDLRIEQLSYFITQTQALSLTNVKGISYTISNEFNNDLLKVGQENKGLAFQQIATDIHDEADWTSGSCTARKIDLKNKWITDFQVIDWQKYYTNNQSFNNDDKIFLLQCIASTQGTDAETQVFLNRVVDILLADHDVYVLNFHFTNWWKIHNWLICIMGNPKRENKTITNTRTFPLIRDTTFSFELTAAQRELLINNKYQFIAFNEGTNIQDERLGFISELELDNERSLCKFKLLTP